MNPRAKFSSIDQAWEQYLVYSPAARTVIQNSDPNFWQKDQLLQSRSHGRWETLWRDLFQSNEGAHQPLEALRIFKRCEMVRLGFIEFATDVDTRTATASLSSLADFCLQKISALLAEKLPSDLKENSLAIIGLGKLGGNELNYSSDIDIVFIYREEGELSNGQSFHQTYNALAQNIAHEIAATSPNGQLYRVDLRLRPEGDKGPLARSIESCENYYAEFGEMWERLAMLKGRFCAGDQEVAYDFLRSIQHFCYARDLLPDLLAEIASLKKRTEKEIVGEANQNYHVKLGRGGIRDIEFYIQGQQLLHGARQPYLQHSNTFKILEALLHLNLIDREKFHTLLDAYNFWRKLEHRIQIIDHRQNHCLPRDAAELNIIAQSLDYENGEQLWKNQLDWRKKIRAIYDEFYSGIERKNPASSSTFLFDPSIFQNANQAERNWRSLTTSSVEFHVSRRTLDSFQRLAPHLGRALNSSLRPDLALTQFVSFVQVYGSRSLLYESLATNPNALKLLIQLFDASQYLGEILRSDPEIFEEVARNGLDDPHNISYNLAGLQNTLNPDPLAAARIFKRQTIVRIALRWLLELAPLEQLCMEFSDLADACLQFAWEKLNKPELAVIALGKHGGQELTFGADLDLLFIGADNTAAQEWTRFMTEKTPAGTLFAIDTRLRPFGEGSLAHTVDEYISYYRDHAQFWEIQALCKARFAAGHAPLAQNFLQAVQPLWKKQAKSKKLGKQMLEMRQKIEQGRCKSGKPDLEFKTGVGGLIDIEFALQYWQMKKNIFEPRTDLLLNEFAKEKFEEATELKSAYQLFRAIEAWLRFDLNLSISHLPATPDALNHIARRCGFTNAKPFMEHLSSLRARTRQIFTQLLTQKKKK